MMGDEMMKKMQKEQEKNLKEMKVKHEKERTQHLQMKMK